MYIKTLFWSIFFCSLLSSCYTEVGRAGGAIHYNRQQGDIIVAAINQYQEDTNMVLDDLEQLLPHYLEELPTTHNGAAFRYSQSDNDRYTLCFGKKWPNFCCYLSNHEIWDCSPGDS